MKKLLLLPLIAIIILSCNQNNDSDISQPGFVILNSPVNSGNTIIAVNTTINSQDVFWPGATAISGNTAYFATELFLEDDSVIITLDVYDDKAPNGWYHEVKNSVTINPIHVFISSIDLYDYTTQSTDNYFNPLVDQYADIYVKISDSKMGNYLSEVKTNYQGTQTSFTKNLDHEIDIHTGANSVYLYDSDSTDVPENTSSGIGFTETNDDAIFGVGIDWDYDLKQLSYPNFITVTDNNGVVPAYLVLGVKYEHL